MGSARNDDPVSQHVDFAKELNRSQLSFAQKKKLVHEMTLENQKISTIQSRNCNYSSAESPNRSKSKRSQSSGRKKRHSRSGSRSTMGRYDDVSKYLHGVGPKKDEIDNKFKKMTKF